MLLLLVCAAAFFASTSAYAIPDPQFEVITPSGLKVSIPNEDGVQVFSFHGNVNREMTGLETGQISQDVAAVENGKFTIYDENVNLQDGDVINYWVYVAHRGLTYLLNNGKFIYQGSNVKSGGCPPGYKKKVQKMHRHDAPQNDGITSSSPSGHDETTGSDGLYNYRRFYQYGFRPNIYYGRSSYPLYVRSSHPFYVRPSYPLYGYGPQRGHDHIHWHGRYHNYPYNRFGNTDVFQTEHVPPIVKREAGSEEDQNQSGDVELESRFGGFSRGFGGANFISPHRQFKPYRQHGYGFYGHGYDHGRDHGYGFHHGHRPHRPYPVGPHPSYPGFGKDNNFNDYYDCEEDDSNEEAKPSEPKNLDTTTSTTQAPEIPEEITSTSSSTTTTTTSTTTQRTSSTFPKIDIRFGDR